MSEQMPSVATAIRKEATRFEGFHHTLESLYRLLQRIDNIPVKIEMRELMNNIEDCFQHSPEFALKPSPDFELRLAVVGNITSGKSALVHRYLTEECPKEESLNGCHKKEVIVDGQSYLLLIRSETGSPDFQFVQWLDALVMVFNVNDELSGSVLPGLYARMAQYRDFSDIPLLLVGIKDGEANCGENSNHYMQIKKRLIEVKDFTYTEVCLETGENVNDVFQLASEKMANRDSAVLTSYDTFISPPSHESQTRTNTISPSSTPTSKPRSSRRRTIIFGTKTDKVKDDIDGDREIGIGRYIPVKQGWLQKRTTNSLNKEWKKKFAVLNDGGVFTYYPSLNDYMENVRGKHILLKQTTVKIPGKRPPVAPTQVPSSKTSPPKNGTQESSRANSLENEHLRNHRKQQNGSLIISNEFLVRDNQSEIKSAFSSVANNLIAPSTPAVMKGKSGLVARAESLPRKRSRHRRRGNKHTKSCELDFTTFPEELQKCLLNTAGGKTTVNSGTNTNSVISKEINTSETCSVSKTESFIVQSTNSLKKKGHRRSKSHGSGKTVLVSDSKADTRNSQGEEYEFIIVSLDGRSWNFAAQSADERKMWVFHIEQQILSCLQSNFSGRDKMNSNSSSESDLQPVRHVAGNSICVDCGEPNPDWVSLNLGVLICIMCSGIHRNLGTHLSRVRSLDLDEWPSEYRSLLLSIGNTMANNIWEGRAQAEAKPRPSSPREEKEKWIRAKYEKKEFLQPLSPACLSLGQRLIEAVRKEDLNETILVLAHSEKTDVNEHEDDDLMRGPLHISCFKGNVVITLLLIWYFVDVNVLDGRGRTALWYARECGSRECEEILRHNGCSTLGRSESSSESSNSGDVTS